MDRFKIRIDGQFFSVFNYPNFGTPVPCARDRGGSCCGRSPTLNQLSPDGVYLSYDRMASFLGLYGNAEALKVAQDLDSKVEALLNLAAG